MNLARARKIKRKHRWIALEEGWLFSARMTVCSSKKYFDVDFDASTYPGNFKRSTGFRGTRGGLPTPGIPRSRLAKSFHELTVACAKTPSDILSTIALAAEPDKVLTLFRTETRPCTCRTTCRHARIVSSYFALARREKRIECWQTIGVKVEGSSEIFFEPF